MAKLDVLDGSIIHTKENSRTILKADSIVDSIVDKFLQRARVGQAKYHTNLDRTDLSLEDWLNHAIEEHMDAILYLEKIKKTITSK
ncbi:MAG: hypothetical protein WCO84_05455 [bacterium]